MTKVRSKQEASTNIGWRIRDRRKQMGLSQAALAERVDIAQQAVYKIEHGISTPGLRRLEAIAKALDLSLADLTNESKSAPTRTITVQSLVGIESEMLSAFRKLPSIRSKRALLQVARLMCSAQTEDESN